MKTTLIILLHAVTIAVAPAQEDEEDQSWSASAGIRFMNRYTNYGIDLSNDQPAWSPSVSLDHTQGFNAGFEGVWTMGANGGLQRWSVSAGYAMSLSNLFSLSIDFSHYQYQNDTANVLAGLSNSLSLSAELDLDVVSLSTSIDQYLGGPGATYFGFDASGFVEAGDLLIVPLAQVTFVSQEVSTSRTKPGGGGKGPGATSVSSSTVILTGISSVSIHGVLVYPLYEGLTLTAHPAMVYSPKAEVSTQTTQFVLSLGVKYTFPF